MSATRGPWGLRQTAAVVRSMVRILRSRVRGRPVLQAECHFAAFRGRTGIARESRTTTRNRAAPPLARCTTAARPTWHFRTADRRCTLRTTATPEAVRVPCPSASSTTLSSSSTRRPAIRSGPSAWPPSSPNWTATGLLARLVPVAARPATARGTRARARRGPRRPRARRHPRGRRLSSTRTPTPARAPGRPRRARPAAPSTSPSRWRAASWAAASRCRARPATTPRATGRWASASSTTWPSPRARCRPRRRRRSPSSTSTSTTATAPRTSSTTTPACSSSPPTSTRSTPARATCHETGAAGPDHPQRARCRPAPATTACSPPATRVIAPALRRFRPRPAAGLGRLRRPLARSAGRPHRCRSTGYARLVRDLVGARRRAVRRPRGGRARGRLRPRRRRGRRRRPRPRPARRARRRPTRSAPIRSAPTPTTRPRSQSPPGPGRGPGGQGAGAMNLPDLTRCDCCPRLCGADRTARRARLVPHRRRHPRRLGVPAPRRGAGDRRPRAASATCSSRHCNLQCVYCQNFQISRNRGAVDATPPRPRRGGRPGGRDPRRRASNRLGFVSPSHAVAPMRAIVAGVHARGLRPTVVYNSGGYDRVEILASLADVVDVYLPDLKYLDGALAGRLSGAPDYPEVAARALREMYRQKGSYLFVDDDDAATGGLVIRHLVLPGQVENSKRCLRFIARGAVAVGPRVAARRSITRRPRSPPTPTSAAACCRRSTTRWSPSCTGSACATAGCRNWIARSITGPISGAIIRSNLRDARRRRGTIGTNPDRRSSPCSLVCCSPLALVAALAAPALATVPAPPLDEADLRLPSDFGGPAGMRDHAAGPRPVQLPARAGSDRGTSSPRGR